MEEDDEKWVDLSIYEEKDDDNGRDGEEEVNEGKNEEMGKQVRKDEEKEVNL